MLNLAEYKRPASRRRGVKGDAKGNFGAETGRYPDRQTRRDPAHRRRSRPDPAGAPFGRAQDESFDF